MLLMEKLNYLFQHIEVVLCEEYRKTYLFMVLYIVGKWCCTQPFISSFLGLLNEA